MNTGAKEEKDRALVRQRYNRASLTYDVMEWPIERMAFRHWRRALLHNLWGRVLEVGVGTGKNLPYYDYNKVQLTGVDLSEGMLRRAKALAARRGFLADLRQMDAEHLDFPDGTFDTVVHTFVLCSVPHPAEVLREIIRVLKPNGRLLMLEHVLSQVRHIARMQQWMDPLTSRMMGAHMDRDTVSAIRLAGFSIVRDEKLMLEDVFRRLECRVQPPFSISTTSGGGASQSDQPPGILPFFTESSLSPCYKEPTGLITFISAERT